VLDHERRKTICAVELLLAYRRPTSPKSAPVAIFRRFQKHFFLERWKSAVSAMKDELLSGSSFLGFLEQLPRLRQEVCRTDRRKPVRPGEQERPLMMEAGSGRSPQRLFAIR